MAAILRSGRGAPEVVEEPASNQTPLRPGTRAVVTPRSAHTRDQRLLEAAYEVDDQHVVGEPHDRVADELPGAVEGDLAAAVDLDHRGAVDGSLVGFGALACRVDGGVLEQQHGAGSTLDHLCVHLALALPRLEVVDGLLAQRLEDQFAHHSRLTRRTQPVDNRLRPRDRRQGGRMRILAVLPLLALLYAPAAQPAAQPVGEAPSATTRSQLVDALEVLHEWDVRRARAWARDRPGCPECALRARVRGGSGRRPDAARLPGARTRRTPAGDAGVRGPGAAQRRPGPPGTGLRPGGRGTGARSRRGGAVAQQSAGDQDDHLPPKRRRVAGCRGQRLGSSPSRSTALTSGSLKS